MQWVVQEVSEDNNFCFIRFREGHPFGQRTVGQDCYFGDRFILDCCTEDLDTSWIIRVSSVQFYISQKYIPAPVTPVRSNLIVFHSSGAGLGSQGTADPD